MRFPNATVQKIASEFLAGCLEVMSSNPYPSMLGYVVDITVTTFQIFILSAIMVKPSCS
jgi:hypothetical protein